MTTGWPVDIVRRKAQFVSVGLSLAFIATVQAALIVGLGLRDVPVFSQLSTSYMRWGALVTSARAGTAACFIASCLVPAIVQWIAGTIVYLLVTNPGPVVRAAIAHVTTSVAVLVAGCFL